MTQAEEIARGLSDHEKRDLANLVGLDCEFAGMHVAKWRDQAICRMTGVGNRARLTDLGREVARCLEEKLG